MKTTSSDYEYGSTNTRAESIPYAVTPDKSGSSSVTLEEGRDETTLPLHHHHSKLTEMQTPGTSMWVTPNKTSSSRVETYHGENTPATATSLDSISPSQRGRIDQQEADEIRLSINFEHAQNRTLPKKLEELKNKVLVQTFVPKFVLEVMGGAGAVWGFSEAIGLRTSSTVWFWRPVTLFVGALFFIRWCRQLQEFRRSSDVGARQRATGAVESETTALMVQDSA